MDTKIGGHAPLNESILSMKQGTESGRLSAGDMVELKNRFNRLQYDCNKSIHSLREQVKDLVDNKLPKLQKQVINSFSKGEENDVVDGSKNTPSKVELLL